jgi:hypothetical protein
MRPNRQRWLRAIQGLDLTLLVDAQYQGLDRRIQIQSHDIARFLDEVRIPTQLERLHAVRLQAVGVQVRRIVASLTPWALAIDRVLQCVVSFGVVCSVAFTIASTFLDEIFFLRPGRGASFSKPSTPASA